MGKTTALRDVIARETISMGGAFRKPGTRLSFPADEAERLVKAGAADWPAEDDETVKPNRPSGRDLLAAIGQAMRAIDPMEGVTPEGKASLYALAHHLGYEVTAEERDEAHAEFSGRRDLFAGAKGAGQVVAEMIEKVKSQDFGDPLLNAIRDLKGDVPANWTQDGRPDARALSEILRRNVSAGERDEAWDKYRKALAELTEKK
ncbi:hypothetical protein [Hoeflea sp.]|uniref:hypothetical protein n=1 Tax=Hoeflea sp. TaxID=1940281 RepID=UPI0019C6AE2F|nr:hypothetical protein [Hoeflea sp.]MBC7282669.1 hypothetical protein [Hoeflea sp.]